MAIDTQAMRLLLAARCAGVDFARTLTFGRQAFFPKARHARRALQRSGLPIAFGRIGPLRHCYGEQFLATLGVRTVEAMDASGYEGATIVHDLNLPVPAALEGRYSVVFDGGTTEHVFDFPQALRNAQRLLAVGGHFISLTAGNNLSGHGFYQISPELFFRVFSRANGFAIVAVLLADARPGGKFYRVSDPAELGERVEFVTRRPWLVGVIARKLSATERAASVPLQSDYVQAWQQPGAPRGVGRLGREGRRVLGQARRWLGRWCYLPWQSRGITALDDRELYSLNGPPARIPVGSTPDLALAAREPDRVATAPL